MPKTDELLERFMAGEVRALARAITWVESGYPEGQVLLKHLRGRGSSKVVGVTGSPGAGKSTVGDCLIEAIRARGARVAVLAVDPSSPFTGGAILGDRIRMMRHHQDSGVFIRSLASRGALGGIAGAAVATLTLLEAFGFDYILIETVGVGQSEVDIVHVADTTLLVLTPAGGDSVQAFKAGVMEIADIFAVNKTDLPGAGRMVQEIQSALELAHAEGWQPPVLSAVAAKGEGIQALLEQIDSHYAYLQTHNLLAVQRLERAQFEVESMLQGIARRLVGENPHWVSQVASGQLTPEEAARGVLKQA
jgi:LAO/AO transport system kinase